MNLTEMLGLPRSGVIILRKGGTVLVSYTTSMGAELLELYGQFAGQSGITIEVVSAGADLETLKLHTEYYRKLYGSTGHGRKAIQYKVRVVPSGDFKYMDVQLVTARGDSIKVVGRFKSAALARDFIETYYGTDNPFCLPVYSANADTKALLLDQQTKLLDIR